jgi:nitrite reductase/ring-hydroxylating ferredoxin subunit
MDTPESQPTFQRRNLMDSQSGIEQPGSIQTPLAGEDLSRRRFIKSTGSGLVALGLIGPQAVAGGEEGDMGQEGITGFFKSLLGVCRTTRLDPELWHLQGSMIRVKVGAIPELQSNSTAVYLEGNGLEDPVLIVHRDEGRYLAFSDRCTHMGRKIDPVPGQEILRCCSVSHSVYDFQGKVLAGPAKEPLTVYPTTLDSGELMVALKRT